MKLHIKCSYCSQLITYNLNTKHEITMTGRDLVFDDKMKCPTCGSVTAVEISTKRKSKGKKMREMEEAAAAVEKAAIRDRAALNKKIGDALLAQPGCVCAERADREEGMHLGEKSGHPLSSGWARDSTTGHMLPTRPRHFHFCPLHNSALEAQATATITREDA